MTEAQQNAYDQAQFLIAFSQGKTIQARKKGNSKWVDMTDSAIHDQWEYRIKPIEIEVWCHDEGMFTLDSHKLPYGLLEGSGWNKKKFREVIE